MKNSLLYDDIQYIIHSIEDLAKKFSGKKILLTGGCGFLGKYFVEIFNFLNEKILEDKIKLIILDNLITSVDKGTDIPNYENVEFINHNVIKKFQLNDKLDFIIHAAGVASPYYYRAFPLETLRVAIDGTRNMLELAKLNDAKFIFFSSAEIYGDPNDLNIPTNENYKGNLSCNGPRACYDESKRVGETLCSIYQNMECLHTNVIRPFNIFGPGMKENDYRVLSNFASRIKNDTPLEIYGTGKQTRTFCYITDAMEGFLRVILFGKPGKAYNIGASTPELSILDLVYKIEDILGKKIKYEFVDYPKNYPSDEPRRRCPDIERAQKEVYYSPKIEIDQGLEKFLNWSDKVYEGYGKFS